MDTGDFPLRGAAEDVSIEISMQFYLITINCNCLKSPNTCKTTPSFHEKIFFWRQDFGNWRPNFMLPGSC